MDEFCLLILNMMFGSNITKDTIRENNSVLKKAFDKNIPETEFDDAVSELSNNLKIDKGMLKQAIKAAKENL